MPIKTVKIHPAIGIARMGNSRTDFFIGPEIPGDHTMPTGGYKDASCRVKRHAQSQQPAHLLRIFREDIKSGKGSAHEKVESAYVPAFSKSGYPSYLALANMSGTSQAWFIERYDTYEAMEKAIHLAEAEPLKTTLDALDAQDGESEKTGAVRARSKEAA